MGTPCLLVPPLWEAGEKPRGACPDAHCVSTTIGDSDPGFSPGEEISKSTRTRRGRALRKPHVLILAARLVHGAR